MPYTISHIEDGNIVCIRGVGRLTVEEYKKGSLEVVDMLRKHNSLRLFVDNRLAHNVASVVELYSLSRFFHEIELSTKLRIALLVGADTPNVKDLGFFETVSRNRGYNMRMFYAENEVIEWLMEKSV